MCTDPLNLLEMHSLEMKKVIALTFVFCKASKVTLGLTAGHCKFDNIF